MPGFSARTLISIWLLGVIGCCSAQQAETLLKSIVPPSLQLECFLELHPSNPISGQLLQISILTRNIGNLDVTWAQPQIQILSAGNLIWEAQLQPFQGLLPPLQSISFQVQTKLEFPGDYLVKLNLSYDSKSCELEKQFRVLPVPTPITPPPILITPPPIILPPPMILPTIPTIPIIEKYLELKQYPTVVELYQGESWVGELIVYNPGLEFELNLTGYGLGPEILEFDSPRLRIKPGFNPIELRIRGLLHPGDYLGLISLTGSRSLIQFPILLRISPQPAQFPGIARQIAIDKANGTTQVTLWVKNGARFAQSIRILEQIPKQLAEDAAQLKFDPPPQIIQPDPLVSWELLDLAPYERRWVSYLAPRILETMAQYAYWPIKQVTVITQQLPFKLILSNITIPTLAPGESGYIQIQLINADEIDQDYLLKLELPWNTSVIQGWISAGAGATIQVPISIPSQIREGSYLLMLELRYDDQSQSHALGFSVIQRPPLISYIAAAALAGIPGAALGLFYRRRLVKLARTNMILMLKRMR